MMITIKAGANTTRILDVIKRDHGAAAARIFVQDLLERVATTFLAPKGRLVPCAAGCGVDVLRFEAGDPHQCRTCRTIEDGRDTMARQQLALAMARDGEPVRDLEPETPFDRDGDAAPSIRDQLEDAKAQVAALEREKRERVEREFEGPDETSGATTLQSSRNGL